MKVKVSERVLAAKPALKKLLEKLLAEYDYASILFVDAKGKNYSVSKSGIGVSEGGMNCDYGVVVKVYKDKAYAEYSFSSVKQEELDKVPSKLAELIKENDVTKNGLENSNYAVVNDEPCVLCESTEYEIHPDEVGDEKIVEKLTAIYEKGMAYSEKILSVNVRMVYQQYTKLFLSKNRDMTESVMWCNGSVVANANEGEKTEYSYKPFSVLGGAELLDFMDKDIDEVCENAIILLSAEPITPGEYECICAPDVTGMIVHEAFGHGVEMDMFVKDRALAKSYVNDYVASELVTMHDGACAAKESATFFFDDEGTLAHDTIVIEKGILKAGISDLQTAMHLGTEPTGNGRRQDHSRKAYTRMTNTFFEAGNSTYEEMLATIKDGLVLHEASSGMEDPKNWGIQCMVSHAHEVKDGKLTGRVFAPIVLTGYVPDLLKSISMISSDAHLSGSGYCGKGYKEWVKVSDGGPYIKAKIRLG